MQRKSITLLIVLLICCFFANTVHATSHNIESNPISTEEKAKIISNANPELIQTDSTKTGIKCFDVSDSGEIAIGIGGGSNCMIYVYDASGVFQYGYRLRIDGAFGLVYVDDLLGIYSLRGNTIIFCNHTGACVDVHTLSGTGSQTKAILNRISKDVGGKKYVLERDMNIGDSYSRLVQIDEDGNRTVLYDVTSDHKTGQILGISAAIGFFAIVVLGCIKKAKAKEQI